MKYGSLNGRRRIVISVGGRIIAVVTEAYFYNNSSLVQLQMIAMKRSESNLRNFAVSFCTSMLYIFLFLNTIVCNSFNKWYYNELTTNVK